MLYFNYSDEAILMTECWMGNAYILQLNGHFEVASSYFPLNNSCKNSLSQFRHCGSLFVIMKLNLTLASRHIKSLYIDTSLLKKQSLSDLLIWRSRTKCFSSSISLQMGHFLSATGVLGLVCLPLSISSICELQRNFAIEWWYFAFFN